MENGRVLWKSADGIRNAINRKLQRPHFGRKAYSVHDPLAGKLAHLFSAVLCKLGEKMKQKLLSFALAMAAIGLVHAIEARGQTTKRIRFANGRNSAVVKGTTARYGASFVVRAKSGQKLLLDLSPVSGVGIKVETVGRYGEMVLLREESGGKYEVGLEETGDYTIFIGALGNNPVTFTLTVKITKLADI